MHGDEDPDEEVLERNLEALHWVRVSLLQVQRFVRNFLSFAESEDKEATQVTADGHFLLNAVAQAEKALHRAGRPVPPDQRTTIRSLRDVHEHWEQHKRSFESRRNAKSRAGRRYSEAQPEHLPWSFKFDATGTYISALRLESLWDELVVLEQSIVNDVAAQGQKLGLPNATAVRLPVRKEFPRRDSRVLGMAMVTQNIIINFDDPSQT